MSMFSMKLLMFKASQSRASKFLLICTGLIYVLSILPFSSGSTADSIFNAQVTPQKPDIQERPDDHPSFDPGAKDSPQIYEPTFVGLDRGLLGRATPAGSKNLTLNVPAISSINGNEVQFWTLPFRLGTRNLDEISSLDHTSQSEGFHELVNREEKKLFITLSLCDQPSPRNFSDPRKGAPPTLELYIYKDKQNTKPSNESFGLPVQIIKGFGNYTFSASDDVYFSVGAILSPDFVGNYTYELTASVHGYYASLKPGSNTLILDSDSNSILLASSLEDLSLVDGTPPYSIFVYNQDDPAVWGLQNSLCGLKSHAQVQGNLVKGILKPSAGKDMQYFHVQGLNASTNYYSTIAYNGKFNNTINSGVETGVKVWNPLSFTTRSDMNCAIIYNLSFCTDTAYAVPYNPHLKLDNAALAKKYDERASELYQNFSLSLQQIPCNAPDDASYSLVRNCTDCAAAYKAWLCAVTIPRCQDFSSTEVSFQPRSLAFPTWNDTAATPNVRNITTLSATNMSARNPWIDQLIKPGPWKEMLPCKDLCYNLVRSCPASLGFSCPQDKWLSWNYGNNSSDCNDPTKPERKKNVASRGKDLTPLLLVALAIIIPTFLGL